MISQNTQKTSWTGYSNFLPPSLPPFLPWIFLPETPVQRNIIIEEHITQAAFGAVLCDKGNIWNFYTTSNEFAEIGMIKFPVKINKKHTSPSWFCSTTGKPSALSHNVEKKQNRHKEILICSLSSKV